MNIEVHEVEPLEKFCIETQQRRIDALEKEISIMRSHIETTEKQFEELLESTGNTIRNLRAALAAYERLHGVER